MIDLEILGRTWQDFIFLTGSIVFAVSLIPAICGRDKPPLATSLMTATMLAIYGFTYATLGLWLSLGGAFLVAGTWYVLAAQKAWRKSK